MTSSLQQTNDLTGHSTRSLPEICRRKAVLSGFDLRPCRATTITVAEAAVDTAAMVVRRLSFLCLHTL